MSPWVLPENENALPCVKLHVTGKRHPSKGLAGFLPPRPKLTNPLSGHTFMGKTWAALGRKTCRHRSGPCKQGQLLSPSHMHDPCPFSAAAMSQYQPHLAGEGLPCSPVSNACHASPFLGVSARPQPTPLPTCAPCTAHLPSRVPGCHFLTLGSFHIWKFHRHRGSNTTQTKSIPEQTCLAPLFL